MVAGAVYMNLHKLDLNDIKGFGRGKILLNFAYLAGFLGIIGMPAFSGYVSKTLIHESIVEYIEELHTHGHGTIIYNIIEWIFLISGGLTAAYMTKLYICLFCEKNNDAKVQEKYDSLNKTYMTKLSAFAIDGSAIIVFILGLNSFVTQVLMGETHSSNATLMDKIATLGQKFMNGHDPSHAVNYFSWANIKGGLISLAIGALVYIFVIRQLLMRKEDNKKVYINIWPEWLDLEDSVYRPILNVLINVFAFVFRIADKLVDGIVALLRSTLFVAINTIKTGDAFAVLNVESKSSKSVKTITDSLSMSLLLFCLGLCIALIYLVVINA
jgi:hydrogenase-4 component B